MKIIFQLQQKMVIQHFISKTTVLHEEIGSNNTNLYFYLLKTAILQYRFWSETGFIPKV